MIPEIGGFGKFTLVFASGAVLGFPRRRGEIECLVRGPRWNWTRDGCADLAGAASLEERRGAVSLDGLDYEHLEGGGGGDGKQ